MMIVCDNGCVMLSIVIENVKICVFREGLEKRGGEAGRGENVRGNTVKICLSVCLRAPNSLDSKRRSVKDGYRRNG